MPGRAVLPRRSVLRWSVRVAVLGVAVFLILGGPLPAGLAHLSAAWFPRVVPALSPLVALSEMLSQRTWYLGAFWLLPPAIVLALAVWRGRWFCRWLCPTGTAHSAFGALGRKIGRRTLITRRVAPYLFYIIVFSALLGLPQLLWLDPLSSFSRLASGGRTVAAWGYGAIVPLFLLLGLVQPVLWCSHFCPLGYCFDLGKAAARRPRETLMQDRRRILVGLLVGVPAATVLPRLLRPRKLEILPPGGGDQQRFAAVCTRCYACVAACPAKIITIKAGGGVAELFMPVIDLSAGEQICREYCNACTQVCPTGAIAPLTLERKNRTQIARASIRREACIAWSEGAVCMVCDEYCPYSAIDVEYLPSDTYQDIPLPVISPQRCRGCGYCRKVCMSRHPDKAVDLLPVERQSPVLDC